MINTIILILLILILLLLVIAIKDKFINEKFTINNKAISKEFNEFKNKKMIELGISDNNLTLNNFDNYKNSIRTYLNSLINDKYTISCKLNEQLDIIENNTDIIKRKIDSSFDPNFSTLNKFMYLSTISYIKTSPNDTIYFNNNNYLRAKKHIINTDIYIQIYIDKNNKFCITKSDDNNFILADKCITNLNDPANDDTNLSIDKQLFKLNVIYNYNSYKKLVNMYDDVELLNDVELSFPIFYIANDKYKCLDFDYKTKKIFVKKLKYEPSQLFNVFNL